MTVIAGPRPKTKATIEDLYDEEGKAEVINGEVVRFPMTGGEPGFAGDAILVSLFAYIRLCKMGIAVGDGKGFLVNLPNRVSFSPDAAYYIGPRPGKRFYEGAPRFAAEVRSENDYGAAAERQRAAKRRDYFDAGTQVVWDVDLDRLDTVHKYRADAPDVPEIFRRGEIADAEPAVPDWRMPVDDLFEGE